jgi:hypothetical protein
MRYNKILTMSAVAGALVLASAVVPVSAQYYDDYGNVCNPPYSLGPDGRWHRRHSCGPDYGYRAPRYNQRYRAPSYDNGYDQYGPLCNPPYSLGPDGRWHRRFSC